MKQSVRFQMMGSFQIFVDEGRIEHLLGKSRKGAALMIFLILRRGQQVSNQRILSELWPSVSVTNPENALKTLVSRLRGLLNQISPGLGASIVSDRGAYHWERIENVKVDLLELMDLFEALPQERDPAARRKGFKRVLELYQGDLYQTGDLSEEASTSAVLHRRYLECVYEYVEMLRQSDEYEEICAACRTALTVDSFDERLHMELMKAMVNLSRISDAMTQYSHASSMAYRYLGTGPSETMRAFYNQLNKTRQSLRYNLNAIRSELHKTGDERGALVCDYSMFKEIYSLQMRNMDRLGISMFLGVIMIGDAEEAPEDYIRHDNIMTALIKILRANLRKGDIITHCAPAIVAVLLPTVNYETGAQVLMRVRALFYRRYPDSSVAFHYRLGRLGKGAERDDEDVEE